MFKETGIGNWACISIESLGAAGGVGRRKAEGFKRK